MRMRQHAEGAFGFLMGGPAHELYKHHVSDAFLLALIGVVLWFLLWVDWLPYRIRIERRDTPKDVGDSSVATAKEFVREQRSAPRIPLGPYHPDRDPFR